MHARTDKKKRKKRHFSHQVADITHLSLAALVRPSHPRAHRSKFNDSLVSYLARATRDHSVFIVPTLPGVYERTFKRRYDAFSQSFPRRRGERERERERASYICIRSVYIKMYERVYAVMNYSSRDILKCRHIGTGLQVRCR